MRCFALLIGFAIAFLSANSLAQSNGYSIDTFAGSDFTGDNRAATSGILRQPEGIVFDFAGNLYIADAADHRIRKVTPDGIVTTIAGNGMPGFSGDDGPAVNAQLNAPYGLAFDGAGGLFIADLGNARVRRIGLDGIISTFAGGGTLTPGGANEGSPAAMMMLSAPRDLAFDNQGALYISDFTGQRVLRVDAGGSMTTFAGTGVSGFADSIGPANRAELSFPAGLVCDRNGAVYIADSGNHLVRRVLNGRISTYAVATTPSGMTFDSLGTLYVADLGAGQLMMIPVSAPASIFPISALDLTFGTDGYLYASQGTTVTRVSFSGASTTVAGGGNLASGDGGQANQALLHHPSGVAADGVGNVYIADRDNNRIRRVAPDGTITSVAAQLNVPTSVSVDPLGNLYVADSGNRLIRKIAPEGTVTTVTFPGLIAPVYALADAHGDVYAADAGLNAIVRISASGATSTVISHLSTPQGFAFDANGNLYFTEPGAARVRRLDVFGNLTNIATGTWITPRSIAVDNNGGIFVVDNGLQRVMHVDAAGAVTTIAGTGAAGFTGDGGDALAAQLYDPWDLSIDSSGVIYVADFTNNRVRRLTPVTAPVAAPLAQISIVNAASLQTGPIAPSMLLYVTGSGLTDLQNIHVLFQTDSQTIVSGVVLAADASKITIVSPAQIDGSQSVLIQLFDGADLVAQLSSPVALTAPAIFADSTGQAMALNDDGTANSATNPAASGSVIVLYGTGEGIDGLPVTVAIGGNPADVLANGPVFGSPGLWQITARVPSGYVSTGQLSVLVAAGSAVSQSGVFINTN